MPNLSESMRGAMAAAAAGRSFLGIPKSVGEKYMAHDKGGKLPKRLHPTRHKRGEVNRAMDRARSSAKRGSGPGTAKAARSFLGQ